MNDFWIDVAFKVMLAVPTIIIAHTLLAVSLTILSHAVGFGWTKGRFDAEKQRKVKHE